MCFNAIALNLRSPRQVCCRFCCALSSKYQFNPKMKQNVHRRRESNSSGIITHIFALEFLRISVLAYYAYHFENGKLIVRTHTRTLHFMAPYRIYRVMMNVSYVSMARISNARHSKFDDSHCKHFATLSIIG